MAGKQTSSPATTTAHQNTPNAKTIDTLADRRSIKQQNCIQKVDIRANRR
jgi:3-mercaptopyruvate sulfurtransferase SseA